MKELLLSSEAIIKEGAHHDHPLFAEYETLFNAYKKLNRQLGKLIKLSDRQQSKLNELNNELNLKNAMLADRELHLTELVNKKTEKVERITIALVNALEDANFANDTETGAHIKRVSVISEVLAVKLDCPAELINKIRLYASLHDVGKVGIPDIILKKPGNFTADEYSAMKNHVIIGHALFKNSADIDVVAKNIILYHHEKWDGTGYISGLAGEDIPLEARIVALADVYDALVSERVYKKSFGFEHAEKVISEEAGKHFDPHLIQIFETYKEELRQAYLGAIP